MRTARRFWTATAVVAWMVTGLPGPAAAEPECGKAPSEPAGADPVRADLTAVTAAHVVTLGRGTEGSRKWDVEFLWTAECALRDADVRPALRNLQGTDASLDPAAVRAAVAVDAVARRVTVTLDVPRDPDKVPAGKYEGTLEVGSGAVGFGKASVTIRHQSPLTVNKMPALVQIVWIVGGLAAAAALFGTQRLRKFLGDATIQPVRDSQDFTTPMAIVVGALALYPLLARVGGATTIPWPAWPVWLGAAGLLGGVVVGILKHRDSSAAVALVGGQRFATALLLSFGAGITVWRAQYLNAPDWALTVESALGLVGVVGGATATSALLFLAPNPTPPDEEPDSGPDGPMSKRSRRRVRAPS
jgi:hypothetical protein